MNTIKYSIFKIIEWISSKETNVYLFVGSDKFKGHINQLKKDSFFSLSKDKENELKNYYSNYDLLKTTIQSNDEVYIIYNNVYEYDTIYNLKQKISIINLYIEIKDNNEKFVEYFEKYSNYLSKITLNSVRSFFIDLVT